MAKPMTTAGEVKCGHGSGKVKLGSGASKLTVGGNAVLRKSDVDSKTVTGCGTTTNPNTGEVQCATASVMSGEASKLTVGGDAVMLDSLSGTTKEGIPPGVLSATAGQSKLEAS